MTGTLDWPRSDSAQRKGARLAELMIKGSELAETIDGRAIPADWPLDVKAGRAGHEHEAARRPQARG